MATPPPLVTYFVTNLDGALQKDAAAEIARRRDRVAKRARDGGLPLRDEGDASGWSSAVLERGSALRRRRGPASSSPRGCGLVVVTGTATATAANELNCRGDEPATSGMLAAEVVAKEKAMDHAFFYACVL